MKPVLRKKEPLVNEHHTHGNGNHRSRGRGPPPGRGGGEAGRDGGGARAAGGAGAGGAGAVASADAGRACVALLKNAAKGEMLRRRAEVIDLARREMGKVAAEGIFNEALGPLDSVSGWAKVVARATTTRRVGLNPHSFPNKRAEVGYVPRGVIGVIAPWNYPVAGLYRSMIPALMTGNGVVLKPSEHTPRTSAWLAERLADALPDGLVQVAQGDGAVGARLIDAGIDACIFTGSPRTGRKVRVHCAERGIPSSVEMGGKDPAIVLADCDIERTVAGITHWTLSNAGQACGAIEIAYVDETIAEDFVARLRRAWTKLSQDGEFADVAPLGNAHQLEIVMAQIEDARAKGAKIALGGTRGAASRTRRQLSTTATSA